MDFTTIEYYQWFLPCTFILAIIANRKSKNLRIWVLTLMSYTFFWYASGWHFLLLAVSTITDWVAGKKISTSTEDLVRKRWLRFSLFVNLGLLGVFKYLDFLIETLNLVTLKIPESPEIAALGIILPVGISFYTFQTMSYTIDIYRKKSKPYKKMVHFACYASFFPQLVAGPIVRADEFKKQIDSPMEINPTVIRLGLTLIIFGIFKKLMIGDNISLHVDYIFSDGMPLDNILLVWWGSLCFGIQIYCDFSAYTDIAIGSAYLFGITLPENFDTPYAARSPQDFWRRWHISLSTWLRDYLYIPLGGSRGGKRTLFIALMGTMLLGGLWHGASWNFILWGFMHGLLLLAHRYMILTNWNITFSEKFAKSYLVIGWFVTQYFVFMTWLIFRLENTEMMWRSLKTFVAYDAIWDPVAAWDNLPEIKIITCLFVLIFILGHGISGRIGGFKHWFGKQNPLVWGFISGILLSATFLYQPAETVDFIYFQF
jgi:alginate O-acetyltransferase complex protein AlgI